MDVSQDEDPNLLWTTDTEGLNINQFNRRGQDVDAIVNENTVENWSDASVSRMNVLWDMQILEEAWGSLQSYMEENE